MTLACARCHDHKFDAISQEDAPPNGREEYWTACGLLVGMSDQLRPTALTREQKSSSLL